MALWCISTGQSPQTWRELTRTERHAFEQVAREVTRRG